MIGEERLGSLPGQGNSTWKGPEAGPSSKREKSLEPAWLERRQQGEEWGRRGRCGGVGGGTGLLIRGGLGEGRMGAQGSSGRGGVGEGRMGTQGYSYRGGVGKGRIGRGGGKGFLMQGRGGWGRGAG